MTGPIPAHDYTSTACGHAQLEDDNALHGSCRLSCKYCNSACQCWCHHQGAPDSAPVSWVDQAREVAAELYAAIGARDLHVVAPELAERIKSDPALFWLRGEAQPPGVWRAPTTKETNHG